MAYLAEWLVAHDAVVKPKMLAGYRHDVDHYIVPRIGRMGLQALGPAVIQAVSRPGQDGWALSVITVSHIHHTLRKALADGVDVEQIARCPSGRTVEAPRSRESTACERDECHRHEEDQGVGPAMSWANGVASASSPDKV